MRYQLRSREPKRGTGEAQGPAYCDERHCIPGSSSGLLVVTLWGCRDVVTSKVAQPV